MTERLYYTDPYLTEFDADVIRAEAHDGRPAVVLDRTAFYPTSGGQPFDTGRLGDVRASSTSWIATTAAILHVLERGAGAAGPSAGGSTGRGASSTCSSTPGSTCCRRRSTGSPARGPRAFTSGSASSTIDLAGAVSAADIDRAEDEANRIVWEDRPVSIRFADADEAAKLAAAEGAGPRPAGCG